MLACGNGQIEIANSLVSDGARIHATDWEGDQAIHWACAFDTGTVECVELLRTNGAKILQPNNDGFTPLFYAIESGNLGIVKYILKHYHESVHTSYRDKHGNSILTLALDSGLTHMADFVLHWKNSNWQPFEVDHKGNNAMMHAATSGNRYIVSMFIAWCKKQSIDIKRLINTRNFAGQTAIDVSSGHIRNRLMGYAH